MSRYSECDDEMFPNSGAFFEATIKRALRGKRGRQALTELREALLALPQPRLIRRALCTVGAKPEPWSSTTAPTGELLAEQGEGVCAVGAYVWWQKVKSGMSPEEAFAALPLLPDFDEGIEATADVGQEAGLVRALAWELAFRNDETYDKQTPEERHAAFLRWIDSELRRPPLAGPPVRAA